MEQSRQLIHYLASGIHAAMYDGLLPFFEVLGPLLNISDSLSPERVNVGMAAFTKVLDRGRLDDLRCFTMGFPLIEYFRIVHFCIMHACNLFKRFVVNCICLTYKILIL